ncbi:LysM peptidoglycan-binding domain-containing protein [Cedecea lapagei]|uniref:LysM peptidoglycan-binding domain-containing protein n=1 Tax=Cedecea lapagei TaxID=158823 RepID=UPI002022D578|nr:LysM domain-containing protein [Cedecea lapagei]
MTASSLTPSSTPAQKTPRTGFEKWQDGINKAPGDTRWNAWDCDIQRVVDGYNRHLSSTPGYRTLDWHLIKAMVWVETGALSSEWHFRPMQIGVMGDPGMTSFLSGKEGGELILPDAWKKQLTVATIRTTPLNNLRAGIGYLLMRMAQFEHRTILTVDSKIYDVTVKPGDSLAKIAKAQGSTLELLQKLNPQVKILRVGQTLKCQKANARRVIAGWRSISTTTIALRYNGGGDPNYSRKLDYALSLIKKGKSALCK